MMTCHGDSNDQEDFSSDFIIRGLVPRVVDAPNLAECHFTPVV